jgi:putative transposase
VDFNLPAPRVVRTLDRIAAERGYPRKLKLDNGPELISVTLADWAEEHNVLLELIKPGRPMQNGFIERFNRSYREAVLDMFVFQSLLEVREQTELWLKEYNEERPHKSLGHLTPREYLLTKKWKSLVIRGCNCGRLTFRPSVNDGVNVETYLCKYLKTRKL